MIKKFFSITSPLQLYHEKCCLVYICLIGQHFAKYFFIYFYIFSYFFVWLCFVFRWRQNIWTDQNKTFRGNSLNPRKCRSFKKSKKYLIWIFSESSLTFMLTSFWNKGINKGPKILVQFKKFQIKRNKKWLFRIY